MEITIQAVADLTPAEHLLAETFASSAFRIRALGTIRPRAG